MFLQNHNFKQSFLDNGYLLLESQIKNKMCDELICEIRKIVNQTNNIKNNFFNTSKSNHTSDRFLINSADNISLFLDPNTAKNSHDNFNNLNKVGHALHKYSPVFNKFSCHKKFINLLKLLGHEQPKLIQSMFIFKQAVFGDAVPAHQDATFLYTNPVSVIGLWFALQDANESNGCLWVLPGGHKNNLKTRFMKINNKLEFMGEISFNYNKKDFIPIRAKKGDMIILHGLLPHLSEKNYSQKTRFAYTLHFIDSTCEYPDSNWLKVEK